MNRKERTGKMGMKAAVFDMDGTLLDSMGMWVHVGDDFLAKLGIPDPDHLGAEVISMSMRQSVQFFREKFALPQSEEELMEAVDKMVEDQYFHTLPPKAGARELLDRLSREGVTLAVATATDRYLVEAALGRTGMLPYFSRIFTCGEVGLPKDDPAFFRYVAGQLGVRPEEMTVFDDALYAVRAAVAAGASVVGVEDGENIPDRPQMAALAGRMVASLADF